MAITNKEVDTEVVRGRTIIEVDMQVKETLKAELLKAVPMPKSDTEVDTRREVDMREADTKEVDMKEELSIDLEVNSEENTGANTEVPEVATEKADIEEATTVAAVDQAFTRTSKRLVQARPSVGSRETKGRHRLLRWPLVVSK